MMKKAFHICILQFCTSTDMVLDAKHGLLEFTAFNLEKSILLVLMVSNI